MNKILIVAVCLALTATSAAAQSVRFQCNFDRQATPTTVANIKPFGLEYTLDTFNNKAMLRGNAGLTNVVVVSGTASYSFIEVLSTGVVQSTTIILNTRKAVHSRHTILGSDFIPAQMYGACDVS